MINKKTKMSIFVMLISLVACCFFVGNKGIMPVYASAEPPAVLDVNYLLGEGGNPYEAKDAEGNAVTVGQIDGNGKFVVGHENLILTATAKENYQLVGWQVTYLEQSNKVENFGVDDTIVLKAKDNTEIPVTTNYTFENGYNIAGEFVLQQVFENLTVMPVFDHIYYNVNINELVEVSVSQSSIPLGSNTLYYATATNAAGITTYTKAYVKIDEDYFYYGNLYFDGTNYYTIHQTLTQTPTEQKVDYLRGAFRLGDKVEIEQNINIVANVKDSTNIDLQMVSINSTALEKFDLINPTETYFDFNKDTDLLRTTNYKICFNVLDSTSYINTVDLDYHRLYVADIKLLVDGATGHGKDAEILAETTHDANEVRGNISIYNYYSMVDGTRFLVKSASDNGGKIFKVVCVDKISKIIDSINYDYYQFTSLAGSNNREKTFAYLSENFDINVDYASIKQTVEFRCLEYIKIGEDHVLQDMDGDVLDSFQLMRGEGLDNPLTSADVEVLENYGYEFKGFTYSKTGEIASEINPTIDNEKPRGIIVYLCYEKIEYTVVFTNYKAVSVGTLYPIAAVSFTFSRNNNDQIVVLNQTDLESNSYEFANKVKLDDSISVSKESTAATRGFNILGYALSSESDAEYFSTLDLTQEFIKDYTFVDNKITIYVHAEIERYELIYYIDPTIDPKIDTENGVIMATLGTGALPAHASVVKYDINDIEMNAGNNNLDALAKKIVISNLQINDVIVLTSEGLVSAEGDTYIFRWFTTDDKSTLPYEEVGTQYNYEATIDKSQTIKVVYSVKVTNVLVSVDDNYASSENFSYTISVFNSLSEPIVGNQIGEMCVYEPLNVGETITIKVENIAQGYVFKGYTIDSVYKDENAEFTYVVKSNNNNLILNFQHIEYRFRFYEHGGGRSGQIVPFGPINYTTLNVDNTSILISKPEGYYVSSVLIKDVYDSYSATLSEQNSIGIYADILTYNFSLTSDQLKDIINNNSFATIDGSYNYYDIHLYYSVFSLEVTVKYGLSNPKNDGRDDQIRFPAMSLTYNFNGDVEIVKAYSSKTVTFNDVPYGAENVKINILQDVPSGVMYSGWKYENGSAVMVNEFSHSTHHLEIGIIKSNKSFIYMSSYETYTINVLYNNSQGLPQIYKNQLFVSGSSVQLTIYDKVEIVANPTRGNGYTFESFTYRAPAYLKYEYDETTWDSEWSSLYIYSEGVYSNNLSSTYDDQTIYYVFEEKIEVFDEAQTFLDGSFHISRYILENGGQLTINVNYKLINLTFNQKIYQESDNGYGSLTNKGTGNGKIDIKNEDLINVQISATKNGVTRDLTSTDIVDFYDQIKIMIYINDNALNQANSLSYDLRAGLILSRVYINYNIWSSSFDSEVGCYVIQFNVQNHMPLTGDIINIEYFVEIQQKSIVATTNVTSSSFYQGVSFFANAKTYGFDGGTKEETNKDELTYTNQYLAKAVVYCNLPSSYNNLFRISGVKIYCDGVLVLREDYSKYEIDIDEDWHVEIRFMANTHIEFQVSPIITYNNDGPKYKKVFKCDEYGNALGQELSVGATSSSDIQMASSIAECVKIEYYAENEVYPTTAATNVGEYKVKLSFINSASYDWLNELQLTNNITLEILQKEIYLSFNTEQVNKLSKVYDGTSDWAVDKTYSSLMFTDKAGLTIPYTNVLNSGNSNLLLENIKAYITENGKEDKVAKANPNDYYNLYLYDFLLKESVFNNNFKLVNADLIIPDCVQINQLKLEISNISVYNKVYDETDKAELKAPEDIRLIMLPDDDVRLNFNNVQAKFDNAEIGANKTVLIDLSSAIIGADAGNYYVDVISLGGLVIYPYSLSVNIDHVGEIKILNKRGLTEKDKVDLIPLNANFSVEVVKNGSVQYANIYKNISQYLRGNNEYSIGYELAFVVGGQKQAVSNQLYLVIPNVKNLTGAYFLTGESSGKIDYNIDGGIIIDLNQMGYEVNHIFTTQKKILLKAWQIVLIVITSVLVVASGVLVFLILRKRKLNRDSIHEKI